MIAPGANVMFAHPLTNNSGAGGRAGAKEDPRPFWPLAEPAEGEAEIKKPRRVAGAEAFGCATSKGYLRVTFAACKPLGPFSMENSTTWPSLSLR